MFSGVHVFQDGIVLREVMLCRRISLIRGHVLQECMSSGWHIFQEDVCYCNTCFTGGKVLLEGMSYRR